MDLRFVLAARRRYSIAILATLLVAGCEGPVPTAPGSALPSPLPPGGPPAPSPSTWSPAGHWEGSSTVESITGVAPSCIAPFWHPAYTETISAYVSPFQSRPGVDDGSRFDMVLHQRASEQCHVQLAQFQNQVSGGPWPYDEFDCLMVPSLCNLGCHFRVSSSEWNCEGTPPEVWIVGVGIAGAVADESPDRIQGTMEIGYAHRPGDYPASGGGYSEVTVVTRFDIRRGVRP